MYRGGGGFFSPRLLCGIMFGVLGCVIEWVQAIVSSDLGVCDSRPKAEPLWGLWLAFEYGVCVSRNRVAAEPRQRQRCQLLSGMKCRRP